MRKRPRRRGMVDINPMELLIPTKDKVTVKQTQSYHKNKHKNIPAILSVTDEHEIIHGEQAVKKQVPKYLQRHTNDIDILTRTPLVDAKETEQKLDKTHNRDAFYIEKGAHPGTWRVKSHATKETIADYTHPFGRMPPHKKIDGHNYVTLGYIKKHNKKVLSDPLSGYRHGKDRDTLNRVIIADKKKRRKK